ncbi:MAG: flagellar hook-basal body protein [Deltaproteobacteria bacterium]|nr:flagellar hook-basal body protein [Deltaproteobacteria bacterium]
MDRGLYNATAAGLIADRQMSIVSNNLANVNTAGFKGQRISNKQQEFTDTLASTIANAPARAQSDQEQTPGVVDTITVTDFAPGPISNTGNPLHAALRDPNGFFVVQTPQGEAYTRAGSFTLNGEGKLVTSDGLPVLGDGGEILLPQGKAEITNNGVVTVNGATISKLRVVEFDDLKSLERTEGTRFRAVGANPRNMESPQVVPESLEMPNVNVVASMVDLVNASKAFEAYTKTVRTIDELNERIIRSARTMG